MAINETGLTKGQVRKLNALRKSVGDDLAEEVFAKWLERAAASSARSKPDPVAMKIVEALWGGPGLLDRLAAKLRCLPVSDHAAKFLFITSCCCC